MVRMWVGDEKAKRGHDGQDRLNRKKRD